jgi:hypothetical protein
MTALSSCGVALILSTRHPSKEVKWHKINFSSDMELQDRNHTCKPTEELSLMPVPNGTAEEAKTEVLIKISPLAS